MRRLALFGAALSAPLLTLLVDRFLPGGPLVSEVLYVETAALVLPFITFGDFLEARSSSC